MTRIIYYYITFFSVTIICNGKINKNYYDPDKKQKTDGWIQQLGNYYIKQNFK